MQLTDKLDVVLTSQISQIALLSTSAIGCSEVKANWTIENSKSQSTYKVEHLFMFVEYLFVCVAICYIFSLIKL